MKKFFINIFRLIGALLALVHGIMVLFMLALAGVAVYSIYTVANMTINQYNESLAWEKTAYEAPLAEIEPALVANVVGKDAVDAASAWEGLEQYVYSLDGQSIPDREAAESLLEEAERWQEVYGLRSDAITRLNLYLELEEEIPEVYVTLDTAKLQSLAQELYILELSEPTVAGQKYMERLREVSSDFAEARSLMTGTVWSVGTVKGGVWTIPYTYTRTDLANVLEQMKAMEKFPALGDVADVLSDIADVLNYNKNAREYFEYQEFKESVDSIDRSQYAAVSSIYTYGQALAFGCRIQAQQVDGFTVSAKSPVAGLYYEGERLDDNDYIRRGSPVTAVINEIYEPIPVPEEPVYEIPIEEEGVVEDYE